MNMTATRTHYNPPLQQHHERYHYQQVKTVVLYGSCAKTPALLEEVVKMFLDAQIEHPGVGDCAKGAALLLAGSRGLLNALPVRKSILPSRGQRCCARAFVGFVEGDVSRTRASARAHHPVVLKHIKTHR